jgi:hypothetical protein
MIWDLRFDGLTDLERKELEDLTSATGGMLRTFTFLDPYDNLLPNSEDYLANTWQKDAGLIITPGQTDPYGTQRASLLSNPTNLSREMYQLLPLPCSFQFISSLYLRAGSQAGASLRIGAVSQPGSHDLIVHTEWNRYDIRNSSSSSDEALLVGVQLPPNTEVTMFGFQLEPTLVATDYKATSGQGGIHERCRLASDRLQWVTAGVNNHSVELSVVTIQQ